MRTASNHLRNFAAALLALALAGCDSAETPPEPEPERLGCWQGQLTRELAENQYAFSKKFTGTPITMFGQCTGIHSNGTLVFSPIIPRHATIHCELGAGTEHMIQPEDLRFPTLIKIDAAMLIASSESILLGGGRILKMIPEEEARVHKLLEMARLGRRIDAL